MDRIMERAEDEAAGIARRTAGELGRPDLILDRDWQQAKGPRAPHPGRHVIGWKLGREQRQELIGLFPPRHAFTVADHVTLAANVAEATALPGECHAEIVGHIDDGRGVEALVVAIDGRTDRPGGGTYHITWSLGPGRRAGESNDVIARYGWRMIKPVAIGLEPALFA